MINACFCIAASLAHRFVHVVFTREANMQVYAETKW